MTMLKCRKQMTLMKYSFVLVMLLGYIVYNRSFIIYHRIPYSRKLLMASKWSFKTSDKVSITSNVQSVVSTPTLLPSNVTQEISAKSVTKDIMAFYSQYPISAKDDVKSRYVQKFSKKLLKENVKVHIDGMHVITILFQSARVKKLAKTVLPIPLMLSTLRSWDREWTERDISTFVYGIRSLECLDQAEYELLLLAAKKISESKAQLQSSRAIGNALYGLQDITSDTQGIREICSALSGKIENFQGDLSGQDIGIGIYGLQGLSASVSEVRQLVSVLTKKIITSEAELDAQALSNALYGLQSMSSDYSEVLALVSALATKISESRPKLIAQAIGSALYGLQKLSSDALEVRTLVATLAEKIESSTATLDAQAIGNALFGLQRMKSNSPEVRALLQAIAKKISSEEIELDAKAIGAALYGLHNMNSDSPQVKTLLAVLADRIAKSSCNLSGQAIADSLYGLRGMKEDCPELRQLLAALGERIDASSGKLDAQEIGNALFGLQSLSSEIDEVKTIVAKLADKLGRSKAYLRPQHIARALLGLQSLNSNSKEVRNLLLQLSKRIAESDRTPMTSYAITDSLYGLQGMTSDVAEVQELIGELAKKISSTAAVLDPEQIGKALFGLQGLSSSASIFQESALGIDADEVQFLLSALWDKIKIVRESMPLSSAALGLQGLTLLKDPIANNIKQYIYLQLLQIPSNATIGPVDKPSSRSLYVLSPVDVIATVRGLVLNDLPVPKVLSYLYDAVEIMHKSSPVIPLSRQDRLIVQRYSNLYPTDNFVFSNVLLEGFRSDMIFTDIGLVVELDGPSHKFPARARFDRVRDEYFVQKLGLKVKRVEVSKQSTDESVKQIKELVDMLRDKKAETEIQMMYASESALKNIYKKK